MPNASKLVLTLFFASFLFSIMGGLILAQEGSIYLDFRNQTLSADIEQTPLRAILTRIKEEEGIWYKACLRGEPTLNQQVSVKFRRLTIKDGLERILSNVNHSLVLKGSDVVGVMLFGKADVTRGYSPRRGRRPRTRRR